MAPTASAADDGNHHMAFAWDGTPTLVIGGAGNLGGAIVQMLLERGATVSSFDLAPHPDVAVTSHVGSISDCAALDRALRDVAVVFHTASVIDIKPIPSPRMHAVNVDGTYNVITCCKRAGVQRLIYTSSLEVVSGGDVDGKPLRARGVDESAPMPVTHLLPYAATKAAAERLVLVANSAQLHTSAVRPGFIMGASSIGLRLELIRAHARRGHYSARSVPPSSARCIRRTAPWCTSSRRRRRAHGHSMHRTRRERWVDRWMDAWMHGCMDAWMHGCMDR